MKVHTIAFLTLAAATAISAAAATANKEASIPPSETLSKEELLRLIESKLNKHNSRRRGVADQCRRKFCVNEGGSCNSDDYICKDLWGCVNGTCRFSNEGDDCGYRSTTTTCHSRTLYCDRDRCRKYAEIGDMCINDPDCRTKADNFTYRELYCTIDGEHRGFGTCQKRPDNYCLFEFKDECYNYTTYCTATNESRHGLCMPLPSRVGEECDPELGWYGCNLEKSLYCFNETGKCAELPRAEQECYDGRCYAGHYCGTDNMCYVLKGKNEECKEEYECKDGLNCTYHMQLEMRICVDHIVNKGDFCNNNSEYGDGLHCKFPYVCEDYMCVDKGYECFVDEDCEGFDYGCVQHKCKGGMKIREGEECSGNIGYLDISSTLQCQPGLVCVRNSSDPHDDLYLCKKAHSYRGHLNYCNSNLSCPYDATCECDDAIGKAMCVPMPVSSEELWNKYNGFLNGGSVEESLDFYKYIIDGHLYYDAEFRCNAYIKGYFDGAASLKVSMLLNLVVALLVMLFFF